MLTLYGMGRSRSLRAVWAAEEAELDYKYISVESQQSRDSAPYRSLNSQGKVPSLTDGKLVLTESAAIVNYLATKNPELQLIPPAGSQERAQYDEMCFFILSELEQPLWTTGKHRFALPEQYRFLAQLKATLSFEFEKAATALLALKGTNEFALGVHFSMADVLLGHTLSWAARFAFPLEASLEAYKSKMLARPAHIRALAKI